MPKLYANWAPGRPPLGRLLYTSHSTNLWPCSQMRLLSKIALSSLAVLGIAAYIVLNPPLDRPAGAFSRQNYRRGPHQVSYQSISWADTSRSTAANRDFKGREIREFKGGIWFPADKQGAPYP